MSKPTIAVHKFSSCDGCQLALLNLGESLLALTQLVDIKHFAEAGPVDENCKIDIAIVEGSISTPEDINRIKKIRDNSTYLITIGACATSGGIQALRNMQDSNQWVSELYATPSIVNSLSNSTPIRDHVTVDLELWGCPVSQKQLLGVIRSLLFGVIPEEDKDKVCMECKRQQHVCVMVTKNEACMGAVTKTGCGALCPGVDRECYGCFGPAENPNTQSLANRFQGIGMLNDEIARRFWFINSNAEAFHKEGSLWNKNEKND